MVRLTLGRVMLNVTRDTSRVLSRLRAVERHGRAEIGYARREELGDAAAIAESKPIGVDGGIDEWLLELLRPQ